MNGLHLPLFAGSIFGITSKARIPVDSPSWKKFPAEEAV